MIRTSILSLARGVNQRPVYNRLIKNQYEYTPEDIKDYWTKKSLEIVDFHFKTNKIYREFLHERGLRNPADVDFAQLPIISKDSLRNSDAINQQEVKANYQTGGSSGTPFSYALSSNALAHLWPNLWRAFSVAGYKPGDKLAMIAGPSLYGNRSFQRKVYDLVSNFKIISAFDMNDDKLHKAYMMIKKSKIKFIYGYTSAVLVFLNYLEAKKLRLNLKGIFTTSETIIPAVYSLARKTCNCEAYDIYGANDGGILTFECEVHQGYHISFERTLVEIIDRRIILTDLINKAFPFVRYEVGDLASTGSLRWEKCSCGRSLPRLESVAGRVNQYLTDVDGTKIHSEFFSHVFKKDDKIKQFQVLNEENLIKVNLIMSDLADKDITEKEYLPVLTKRFKKPVSIRFDLPIEKLANQKTPILVNR